MNIPPSEWAVGEARDIARTLVRCATAAADWEGLKPVEQIPSASDRLIYVTAQLARIASLLESRWVDDVTSAQTLDDKPGMNK